VSGAGWSSGSRRVVDRVDDWNNVTRENQYSGIVLVYMTAQVSPTVNHQTTQANKCRNLTPGSYHIDIHISSR